MRLTITTGPRAGTHLELEGALVVGRDETCGLVLDDEQASRRHASLTVGDDGLVTIEDLGSTNGTTVDGRRLTGPMTLRGGERIQIGDTVLELQAAPGSAPTTVEPAPAVAAGAPPAPAPTPSAVARLTLTRTARRTQILAGAIAGVALVGIVVAILFATGTVGGEDQPPQAANVVTAATPATVQIVGLDAEEPAPIGSGWVYDAAGGLVVTTADTVGRSAQLGVRHAGEADARPATIVGVDQCDDLAVLRLEDTDGLASLELADQAALAQGDRVVSLGYPSSSLEELVLTASEGVVSVVRTAATPPRLDLPRLPNLVQSTAAINALGEGGPLVDGEGRLVGVNAFQALEEQGALEQQFYAIGVDRVKLLVPALAAGESAGWTGLGVFPSPDAELLAQFGLPAYAGLLVTNVKPGSPAEAAGLQAPSLVVRVNGTDVSTMQAFCDTAGELAGGASATLDVALPGSEEILQYTVGFE